MSTSVGGYGFVGWARKPGSSWIAVCTASRKEDAESEAARWAKGEGLRFVDIQALPAGQRPHRDAPFRPYRGRRP